MTAFDRFDPFERRIGDALEGIAPPRPLDYLDDIFRQTARTSQRPRWSFPERWFNVDTTLARPMLFGRRVPYRSIIVLAVLAALLATAVTFYVGSLNKPAPVFGPAGNGSIVYTQGGDLYVRDALTGEGRLLVGGPATEDFAGYTMDGTHLTYVSTHDGADHLIVANADGSAPVEIAVLSSAANTYGAVSPDGKTFALSMTSAASRRSRWWPWTAHRAGSST